MTFTQLFRRNLLFHWRANLALVLGVAVGTAVLTGALLVGDSLRGSLRDLTIRQLGWVHNTLITGRFIREDLALQLGSDQTAPVILLQGSAQAAGEHPRRSGKVTILGVDDRFWKDQPPPEKLKGDAVILNAPLAQELNVVPGDKITLHTQKASDVPRETWLGRSDASEVLGDITVTVAEILPDDSPAGRFNLRPSSSLPRNAYVSLKTLQEKLNVPGRVNAILTGKADPESLQKALRIHLTLDDWGLILLDPDARAERLFQVLEPRNRTGKLKRQRWEGRVPKELADLASADGVLAREQFVEFYRKHHNYLSLESRQMLLEPAVEYAAATAAEQNHLRAAPTLVYLANWIASERTPEESVPYSVIAALDTSAAPPLGPFFTGRLGDDEIILAGWSESPLHPQPGDPIRLTFFAPERHGSLAENSATFRFRGVVPLEGPAFDPDLTPNFPGITDRLDIRNWDPPFPYDNKRIKTRDEDYWKHYRTTPKAYVTLKAGQKLWASRFGRLTSVRLARPEDGPNGPWASAERKQFEDTLLTHLDPEKAGLVFNPVRDEALKASSGGTDFSELFLGFSFFLIAAALLLVGLLFRLSLERRASELGLLFAVGFRRATVRNLLLSEGTALAALGAVLGSLAALGYAYLMLVLLVWLWPTGLEQSFLKLHTQPQSFAIGYIAAVAVSVLTIAWAVRVLGKASPSALILGSVAKPEGVPGAPSASPRGRISKITLILSILGAIACLALGPFVHDSEAKAGAFFTSGLLLLVAGLTAAWIWMKRPRHQPVEGHGFPALAKLGCRNATRNPLRSLLTAGLLASAAFLIVAVDSFRRQADAGFLEKHAGSGGFALLAESDVPIFEDMNAPEGQDKLNFSKETRAALKDVKVYSLRLRAGDDTSCLNLYQPRRPRVLGVPRKLVERGGFEFQATEAKSAEDKQNSWLLLLEPAKEGVVPVFGEANTVTYMLHSSLGDDQTLKVPDEQGKETRLRVVGLLKDSVFQSELLMSEENFLKLYPAQSGYNYFLIEAPPDRAEAVRNQLQDALADFGFTVTPSRERLQSYLAVENTYLSTFQVLGSLGLLLGALGLAVVLLRNVWERRAELALLRALGYRNSALGWLVFSENAFLLALGLVVGTVAALLAVAPHLLEVSGGVPVLRLLAVLGVVLAVGLIAGEAAIRSALKTPLLPALRRE
jgi:ABC-type lipoprotein release transport system permease subunit